MGLQGAASPLPGCPQTVSIATRKCRMTFDSRDQPWRVRDLSCSSPNMEICMFPYISIVYAYETCRNMINPDALEAGPYPHHIRFRKRRFPVGWCRPDMSVSSGPLAACSGSRVLMSQERGI